MHGIRELSERWRGQDRDDDKDKDKQSIIKIKNKKIITILIIEGDNARDKRIV